ncbi:hypothetical protein ACLKA6_006052 [Drosophila palustris]
MVDAVVTSAINVAIAQANQTYRHSLRSGISDALQDEIRAGFLDMMKLVNEMLKSQEFGSAVRMPPELVLPNLESAEQEQPDAAYLSHTRRLVTDPLIGRGREKHKFLEDDCLETELWGKQQEEWLAGAPDQSFCFEPG